MRDVIVRTAATLAAERGPVSLTMSEIAARSGIGRATLYRYFPDVEAIVRAWHEQQIHRHLSELVAIRDRSDPDRRLEAVLEGYALLAHGSHRPHGPDLSALLHGDPHVQRARDEVRRLVAGLIAEAAEAGRIREDVPSAELASYCIHALGAAAGLRAKPAVRRLVEVILAGLQPSR